MSNFLAYQPTALDKYRSQATPRSVAGAHPAVVSYLSQGQPLRQTYLQVMGQTKPQKAVPPGGGSEPLAQPRLPPFNWNSITSGPRIPSAQTFAAPDPSASYMDDPILQKMMAARDAALKTARGDALSQYKELLLGFGSQQLAHDFLAKVLGNKDYADAGGVPQATDGHLPSAYESFVGGISDNPDTSQSTLGRLARALRESTTSTNEGLSKSEGGNLFFSGARAKGLRELDYQHQGQVSDATQSLQQALGGITRGVTATEGDWQARLLGEEENAYMRALNAALAAAGSASGGGNLGTPGVPPGVGNPALSGYWARVAEQKRKLGYGTTLPWTAGL